MKLTATLDPTAEGITNLDRAVYRASQLLLGSRMKVERRSRPDFSGDDYTIKLSLSADPMVLAEALSIVDVACQPLDNQQIHMALENLYHLVAHRNPSGDDLEAQRRAYAHQLKEWPADVAMYVLSTQARDGQWWPSWFELERRLENESARRMVLRRALKRRVG